MDKIEIKSDIRYVVATMDGVPMFLTADYVTQGTGSMRGKQVLINAQKKYSFCDNVARASKAASRDIAHMMLREYLNETHDERSFTVLPIEVSYKILDGD